MTLLDANVLLELLITGRPGQTAAIRWLQHNQDDYCISMLSVHLVLHFGLKDGLTAGELRTFLADYPKIALLPEDYARAIEIMKDRDHEDALQLAQAERAGCSRIVTFDKKFAQTYGDRIRFEVLGTKSSK